jgi:hypothetical protein
MNSLIRYIEGKNQARSDWHRINLDAVDLLTSPKNRIMGVKLKNDFLLLNVKYFYSFRFKIQNINFLDDCMVLSLPYPLDKEYLENYFNENQDNPYAIQHIMNCFTKRIPINNLTQFPPLRINKKASSQREALEKMYSQAQLMDSLFTYDRTSGISRLIRKIDSGPWSHVGMIDKNKNIVEMTTSGIIKTDFFSLCNPMIDIGLYRIKDLVLNEQQKEASQKKLEDSLKQQIKFDWLGILKVFLIKKFNLPIRHRATPAELIYSNKFELISYA